MSALTERANNTYRDYEVFGVPASTHHEPAKFDIRGLWASLDSVLSTLGIAAGGAITVKKATKALLDADLAYAADTLAIVYADDGTPSQSGIYVKLGGVGFGSWSMTDLLFPATAMDEIATILAAIEDLESTAAQVEDAKAAAEAAQSAAEGARDGAEMALDDAILAKDQSVSASNAAEAARDQAVAAAEAVGPVAFFDTKADADLAVGGLTDGDVVEVFVDEDHDGQRTLYRVEAGVLVFKAVTEVQFTAASGTKVRSPVNRLREIVSLADYWSPGDDPALLPTSFANAFTDGKTLEIPQNWPTISGLGGITMTVPAGKSLQVGTRLEGGANGRIYVQGSSEIYCEGGWLHDVWMRLEAGTPRLYGLKMSGRSNTQRIGIWGLAGVTYKDVLIKDIHIEQANYGILGQGSISGDGGGITLLDGLTIENAYMRDLHGDGINLNQAGQWSNVKILYPDIADVDSNPAGSPTFWGIGISGAGLGPYDDTWPADRLASRMLIVGARLARMRQGIHFELSENFEVYDTVGTDILDTYSVGASLDHGLIAIYGSRGFKVEGVKANKAGTCRVNYGVNGGNFVMPPHNFALRNFDIDEGDLLVSTGDRATGVRCFAKIQDITLRNGFCSIVGRAAQMDIQSIQAVNPRASGTALRIDTNYNGDPRGNYRAAAPHSITLRNCAGWDQFGAASHTISGLIQTRLDHVNNNFPMTGSAVARRLNRVRAVGDMGLVGGANTGRPYGVELEVGESWINTYGGIALEEVVTSAGSYNKTADNFVVDSQANRIVRSTNHSWTSLWNHEAGQRITLSNIGAAGASLATTVVRTFLDVGSYKMEIADPISAIDGTAGTITATTQAVSAAAPVRALPAVTATVDPASLAINAATTTAAVTVTGAALGDYVDASFSLNIAGVQLVAWVSAANTVSYFFINNNGANPTDLGSGTLTVQVRKK